MYMKSLIPVTAALLLLAACGQRNASRQTAQTAAQTAAPDMHDAENALDYQGTYTGVFPAADVPGIAVTLTLGPDRGNQKTSRTGFVREVERNGTEAPLRRMRCYYLLL